MTEDILGRVIKEVSRLAEIYDIIDLQNLLVFLQEQRNSHVPVTAITLVVISCQIRLTMKQAPLIPADILHNLNSLLDILDRQALASFKGHGQIKVFVASPSDLYDERQLVHRIIERINIDPLYRERVRIEEVAWDKLDDTIPMPASMTPQEAIASDKPLPSECDIVVVLFWTRMGTLLNAHEVKPKEFRFPTGVRRIQNWRYLSGTEWEYVNAMQSANESGKPVVLVYCRTEKVLLDPDEQDLANKLEQRKLVKAFFKSFNNPDTSIRHNCTFYKTPSEFEDFFEITLRKLAVQIIETKSDFQSHEESLDKWRITSHYIKWPLDKSPFPGLRSFTRADSLVFFGRGREVDELIKRLKDPHCHFLAIVGASGSGKSSLVGAGLLPRLAENAIEGSKDWLLPAWDDALKQWNGLRFTPSESANDPFMSFAFKLAPLIHEEPNNLAYKISSDHNFFDNVCNQILLGRPLWSKMLIFIDQFEELFTLLDTDSKNKSQSFIELLNVIAKSDSIRIVVTMRDDFYHYCVKSPTLSALINKNRDSTFTLSAPGLGALYEMIARPAEIAGLEFDQDLSEKILLDTGENVGALALMAYALDELYKSRTNERRLTQEAYEDFGGVLGAIGTRAEDVFNSLDKEAQDVAPEVFFRLAKFDERGVVTRERVRLDELANKDASRRLVDVFTSARTRLLVQTSGDDNQPIVEVAHEAIFTNWPRLANWIGEIWDARIIMQQVTIASKEWDAHGRPEDFLWKNERLRPVYNTLQRLSMTVTEALQYLGLGMFTYLSDVVRDFIKPEQERLLEALDRPETDHASRNEIGLRLHRIGEIRPGVGLVSKNQTNVNPTDQALGEVRFWDNKDGKQIGIPDIVWLPVKGGKIILDENTGTLSIKPFFISKYPITFAQFQAFLDANDGFHNDLWWENLPIDEDNRSAPGEQGFPYCNHPRENVSWYDAIAFCQWLNARLDWPLMSRNLSIQRLSAYHGVRLPTEWEWQMAAILKKPATYYPWGHGYDSAKANTHESGLSRTTAVGMYPAGIASSRALDMTGNVWEWCLNEFKHPMNINLIGTESRSIRGGSWSYDLQFGSGGYRNKSNPYVRENDLGFRLVLCHSIP